MIIVAISHRKLGNLWLGVRPFVTIARPGNSLLAGVATFLGALAVQGLPVVVISPQILLGLTLGFIATSLLAAGGYVINDCFDIETDRLNAPHRPLPSGQLSLQAARRYAFALFFFGIVVSVLTLNPIAIILAMCGAFILYKYASEIKSSEKIVGNFIVAILTVIPILYGGVIATSAPRVIFPTAFAFLLVLTREIVKDVEDVLGDRDSGTETSLALTVGVRKASLVAIFMCALVITLNPVLLAVYQPIVMAFALLVVDVLIIGGILFMLRRQETDIIRGAGLAKKLLKLSMFIGMAGFLLASIEPIGVL